MKERVKITSILNRNSETTTFLVFGRRVVLRNSDFKFGKKSSIIIERDIAARNGLRWKLLFHFPPRIAPIFNQSCIDELRFGSEEGC